MSGWWMALIAVCMMAVLVGAAYAGYHYWKHKHIGGGSGGSSTEDTAPLVYNEV